MAVRRMQQAGIWLAWALCGCLAADAPRRVQSEALDLARAYLAAADEAAKQEIARRLDAHPDSPESVVLSMRPEPLRELAPGYYEAEHFQTPELRRHYPDDLLYYVVPESYDPARPMGLGLIMHGGAKGTERTMAHWYARTDGHGSGLGEALAAAGMIAVAPSAPVSEKTWERWCLPEADDYIRDVIVEFANRFNIDPDRVFLIGHSMGGFGAYQNAQVQPDRFAAVLVSAGSWYLAYWPVLRGTPLWLVHGVRDAERGKRPHYTDVAFPRLAARLLTEQAIAHEYREHPGLHSIPYGMDEIRHFIARMPDVRRDPYHPHVTVVRPRGWRQSDLRDAPHNRWLSLIERTEGKLTYDATRPTAGAQDWENWRLEHVRRELPGAMVEAINRGGNRFEVTTRNVRRFAIRLHPAMVDFSAPVLVDVDGRRVFEKRVKPSISAALRSYELRRDWGLIYTAEVESPLDRGAAE